MTLLYEHYLEHYQAAQRALADKQLPEARRRLLMASRALLEMAGQTRDEQLRADRKKKGLRLLELAGKIRSDENAPGASPSGRQDPASSDQPVAESAEGGKENRWQVTEKPGIAFDDIAGLDAVKDLIRRRVILPFRRPDLAEQYGRKPGGGILMYGPPGTGKTMMAKAIATELDAAFFNVQCSDIMSKWVGDAEANLRELFQVARSHTASVIFLDETEALISRRGGNSTVMNRLIPEFLAQIDGLKSDRGGLLMLGATNRPWDLDPAAMRHGRFGEHVYVGLPDPPARRFILQSTLGKIPRDEQVDVDHLAERTDGYSGADLHGLVDRIVDPAFEQAMLAGKPVPVCAEGVERGLEQTRPSVSQRELARYEKFRREGE